MKFEQLQAESSAVLVDFGNRRVGPRGHESERRAETDWYGPGTALATAEPMLADIEQLRDRVIEGAIRISPRIEEGTVESVGAPAYRRLDVDGRALAYLRLHRKSAPRVRVDVTGWFGPVTEAWARPYAAGAATLWICEGADAERAAALLAGLVDRS